MRIEFDLLLFQRHNPRLQVLKPFVESISCLWIQFRLRVIQQLLDGLGYKGSWAAVQFFRPLSESISEGLVDADIQLGSRRLAVSGYASRCGHWFWIGCIQPRLPSLVMGSSLLVLAVSIARFTASAVSDSLAHWP